MCALPVVGTGSGGGISASYLNQLIAKTMETKRQPLLIMQQEQARLRTQRALYGQLNTLLSSLSGEAAKLKSGSASILSTKAVTVSDPAILTATASASAASGSLTISDVVLGVAHQVGSTRFDHANTPLGFSGSFQLGGQAERSTASAIYRGPVTGFSAAGATIASGQTELGSGNYRVEFQQIEGAWKFRLIDAQGQAVAVANASQAGAYTSGWQDYGVAANPADGSHTFDTGRGLKITFSGADPDQAYFGDAGPSVEYRARGATITVAATDTLQALRDKINKATYAAGNSLQAGIIDNRLVLTAGRIGYKLEAADGAEGLLGASGLKLLGNEDADGDGWSSTLAGWDKLNGRPMTASLTVNGIKVTSTSNTGLTDVVSGMTFNLLKDSGTTKVTVGIADDTKAATDQATAFATQFNKVLAFLVQNTATTKNGDGTYTRAGLASDSALGSLRLRLVHDLIQPAKDLPAGAPTTLAGIGLSVEARTMQVSLADAGKFASQLTANREGVVALLDKVMGRLTDTIESFTGSKGLLSSSTTRLEAEEKRLSNRISDTETRLSAEEMLLTRKYARSLAALADMQGQQSLVFSIMSFQI